MEGLPEAEYHFTLSRQIGLIVVMGILITIPFTLNLVKQRQPSEQYSAEKCIARPSCLDNSPTCALPEPLDGWCPPSGPPLHSQAAIPTASVSTGPVTNDTCTTCRSHLERYLCFNQKENYAFLFFHPSKCSRLLLQRMSYEVICFYSCIITVTVIKI